MGIAFTGWSFDVLTLGRRCCLPLYKGSKRMYVAVCIWFRLELVYTKPHMSHVYDASLQ